MYRIKALILLLVLSGCATQPEKQSLRHTQANESALQGENAYLGGQLKQALHYYQIALQQNSAIENYPGMAANLLSLAQVYLELGEYVKVDSSLQTLLTNPNYAYQWKVEAAARAAQLALLSQQTAKADALLLQAQSWCDHCPQAAAILNLQAEVSYARLDFARSVTLLQLAVTKAEREPVELANAWRLQARIKLAMADAATAATLLEQALSLDKQLGIPKKIAADLSLLAEVKEKLGLPEEAAALRVRVQALLLASGVKLP